VSTFNRAVRPGGFDHSVLDNCRTQGLTPEKTHWARALDTPPFWAYPLRPGVTFTYLGLKVDERARVLMSNGAPAENIVAAGEIMAGNILGQGYVAGVGMTIGTVFGRIAGGGRPACRLSFRRRASTYDGPQRLPLLRGVFPVFQTMENRTSFAKGDLLYLSNLCHNCGECLYACQYAPPHEFGINVPRVMAEIRVGSYEEFCWPGFMSSAFKRSGVVASMVLSVVSMVVLWPFVQSTAMPAISTASSPTTRWPSFGIVGPFVVVVLTRRCPIPRFFANAL
jgi:hypothetical protein